MKHSELLSQGDAQKHLFLLDAARIDKPSAFGDAGAMQPKMARRAGANDNGNLAVRIVSLSARRQRVIRPVLANPRQFVLLRDRHLAEELDTDAATIVRIVRGMY